MITMPDQVSIKKELQVNIPEDITADLAAVVGGGQSPLACYEPPAACFSSGSGGGSSGSSGGTGGGSGGSCGFFSCPFEVETERAADGARG